MTSPPIPSGSVTAADLFGEVTAARRDIATVLTKVEVMTEKSTSMGGQLADHEARIRALADLMPDKAGDRLTAVERWQWRAAGALVVIAVLAGVLSGWLSAVLARGTARPDAPSRAVPQVMSQPPPGHLTLYPCCHLPGQVTSLNLSCQPSACQEITGTTSTSPEGTQRRTGLNAGTQVQLHSGGRSAR